MPLSRAEVENIAHLARLDISEDQIPVYAENLSRIIDFVAQLNAAETSDTVPMAHPLNMAQRLRDDNVKESDHRERYQANAPKVGAGLYLVPKVIE